MRKKVINKTCSKCRIVKPVLCFSKAKAWKDGYYPQCKGCVKEYRNANKATIDQGRESYWAKRPDQYKLKQRNSYLRNKEKRKAKVAEWKIQNPELVREYNQNRKAKKRGGDGKITPGLHFALMEKQNGKCVYCHCSLTKENTHLDHRMPLALGGEHSDENMQLLCADCNLWKRAKHPDDFERLIKNA